MNPDDYDDDGNNIVPCPICMSKYCPSKYCPSKEDGKCPDEDMFALEGEIRMLLSEYKETGDNSRIVNVLEAVEHLLTEKAKELQKAREEERERIKRYIQKRRKEVNIFCAGTGDSFVEESMKEIVQSVLNLPNK